jgi:hypothetical protein
VRSGLRQIRKQSNAETGKHNWWIEVKESSATC